MAQQITFYFVVHIKFRDQNIKNIDYLEISYRKVIDLLLFILRPIEENYLFLKVVLQEVFASIVLQQAAAEKTSAVYVFNSPLTPR